MEPVQLASLRVHCMKAPPVNPLTCEQPDVRLDKRLSSLERARVWNDWIEELLLPLAVHFPGRALQESGLLNTDTKKSFTLEIEALHLQLDPES